MHTIVNVYFIYFDKRIARLIICKQYHKQAYPFFTNERNANKVLNFVCMTKRIRNKKYYDIRTTVLQTYEDND